MTFAHPLLLAVGLGSVALPVLIHILMRRRRRPVRWGAMRFLAEAYRRQRKRIRLEQWLLLAARCLIVALAAAAIARPMMSGGDALLGSRATTLYLVIDNGLTATHGSPSALDRHREGAITLLGRLDPLRGDRAAVYAAAGPAAGVVSPPSSATQSVAASVREIAPADSASDLHGALSRIAADISQDAGGGGRPVVVVLSEFRAGSSPVDRPLPALGEPGQVSLAASPPAAASADNVAIVGVVPLRPVVLGSTDASTTPVRVRAMRFGPGVASRLEVPVEILAGRAQVAARGVVVFEPGERESSVALGVDGVWLGDLRRDGPGPVTLTARLGMSDGLWRDDQRRAVVDRRDSIHVGIVAPRRIGPRPSVASFQAGDWVEAALDPEGLREGGEIRTHGLAPATVDASALSGLDAVVVAEPQGVSVEGWAALRRFADMGGLVVLLPQPGTGAQLWTDGAMRALGLAWSLPREPATISEPAGPGGVIVRGASVGPLLSMVEGELLDLLRPVGVTRAMPVVPRGERTRTLLALEDGRAVAVAASPGAVEEGEDSGRGLVVYLGIAMDLEWSDLPTKPLLVPMLQEFVRQGLPIARGGWEIEAGQTPIGSPGAVELVWAGTGAAPAGAASTVPLQPSGLARQPIRHAGVYAGLDSGGASHGLVVVNSAAAGSNTEARSAQDIAAWLETAGAGRVLWLDAGSDLSSSGAAGSPEAPRRDWSWLPVLFGLALALAVLEAVAGRYFSHAFAGAGGVVAGAAPGGRA